MKNYPRTGPCLIAICALALALGVWRHHMRHGPPLRPEEIRMQSLGNALAEVATLSQANQLPPFVAKVLYRSNYTDSLIVFLRRTDGRLLAISENNTNSPATLVLKSLVDGARYRFPLGAERNAAL